MIRNWKKWREKKRERSERARRAVEIRWARYHETMADEPPECPLPDPCFRLTYENFFTGETHMMVFHPGKKSSNFQIDVDGKPWTVCGWSKALARIRKSCVRIARRPE